MQKPFTYTPNIRVPAGLAGNTSTKKRDSGINNIIQTNQTIATEKIGYIKS